MDAQGWVTVIGAVFAGVTATVTAIFTGLIMLRQLPAARQQGERVAAQVQEVKTIANGNLEAARAEAMSLRVRYEALLAHADPATIAAAGAGSSAGGAPATGPSPVS